MAKKRCDPEFYCDLCGKQFEFRSKYSRHIESAIHRRYAESLEVEVEQLTPTLTSSGSSSTPQRSPFPISNLWPVVDECYGMNLLAWVCMLRKE